MLEQFKALRYISPCNGIIMLNKQRVSIVGKVSYYNDVEPPLFFCCYDGPFLTFCICFQYLVIATSTMGTAATTASGMLLETDAPAVLDTNWMTINRHVMVRHYS